MLKKQFPFVDGLHCPSIKGVLVIPASSEFIQILNVGRHWVCMSTIACCASIPTWAVNSKVPWKCPKCKPQKYKKGTEKHLGAEDQQKKNGIEKRKYDLEETDFHLNLDMLKI